MSSPSPRPSSRSPARISERSTSRSRSRSRSARRSRSPVQRGSPRLPSGDEYKNDGRTLYVAGFHSRTNERDLEHKFDRYGAVKEVFIVRDPRTQESRGFAFITMETREAAADAARGLNRSDLDGRWLQVEVVRTFGGSPPSLFPLVLPPSPRLLLPCSSLLSVVIASNHDPCFFPRAPHSVQAQSSSRQNAGTIPRP